MTRTCGLSSRPMSPTIPFLSKSLARTLPSRTCVSPKLTEPSRFVYLGNSIEDGLFAWIQIGINGSADYTDNEYYGVAAYLDAEGGHSTGYSVGGGGGSGGDAPGGNGTAPSGSGTFSGPVPTSTSA